MTGRTVLYCVSAAAVLLAVNSAREARAQGRGGMGRGQGVNPLMILSSESVQKELGLKPEQVEKVKDIANDVRDEMREEVSNSGIDFQLQDLSREERAKKMAENQAKMAEIGKKINARFMPKVNEILDKTQQTRLHQIAVQAAGAAALQDAEVAKDLGLSKEQQDKLKKLAEDFQHQMMEAFAPGADRTQMREKMTQLRTEHKAKATEVLTKEQQAKFTEMEGKPFDTRSLMGGGRRRRAE